MENRPRAKLSCHNAHGYTCDGFSRDPNNVLADFIAVISFDTGALQVLLWYHEGRFFVRTKMWHAISVRTSAVFTFSGCCGDG